MKMKLQKLVVALVATVAVFVQSACALPQGQGAFPDPVITVVASIAPLIPGSPSGQGFVNNVVAGLQGGASPVGNPLNPTFWAPLIGDQVSIERLISTPDFNSWNGQLNPTGPMSGQWGNMLTFNCRITSEVRFTFAEVGVRLYSPGFFDFETTLGEAATYRLQGIGIYWGADGDRNTTADNVIYGSGNENVFVNEINILGISQTFQVFEDPSLSHQDSMKYGKENFMSGTPFDITATYSLGGVSGSRTLTVVPEPSTWALLGLGLIGGSIRWLRKKH